MVVTADWVSSAAFSPLIISRSNVPELSKNIIQKGLAFARDWSGTVAHSGSKDAQRSCPAGSVADAGLRWCGATPLPTERRISNVKGCEEIIIYFDNSPRCQKPLAAGSEPYHEPETGVRSNGCR